MTAVELIISKIGKVTMSEWSGHSEIDCNSLKWNLWLYSIYNWTWTKWPVLAAVCALQVHLVVVFDRVVTAHVQKKTTRPIYQHSGIILTTPLESQSLNFL